MSAASARQCSGPAARDAVEGRVHGLDLGAVDYLKHVKVNDVAVDLTVREWALLEPRPGRVLRKEKIARQLVNYEDTLSLDTVARVTVRFPAAAPEVALR